MFCSELVTALGALAAKSNPNIPRNSASLRQKSPGLFYRDPNSTLPVHLHGAMLRSQKVETVGCIIPNRV